MEYVVVKNFKDKYTNQYYGMGFTYETENAERAAELERGGYIAEKGSEMAQMVQSNQTLQSNQTNKQSGQAMEEAYTVINGKRVSLSQAQAAQEAQERQAELRTGIQKTHDNSTEAVKAGAKGKQTQSQQQQQPQHVVKTANIQSGQQELEQHMQQKGQTSTQALDQQAQQQAEQAQQAKTRAKAKNQASE